MKDLSRKSILAALLVCAAVFVSQEAGAQKKSRKKAENLNGTIVYVDPLARTSPVEEKLKAKNKPAIEYAPTKTVYLYPKGQNIDQGIVEGKKAVTKGPLVSNGLTGPEKAEGWGFIANVTDSARIDIYLPEKPNGQMVIASPGGSYYNLSSWNEGSYVAKWMNDRGIACAVVKYRLSPAHLMHQKVQIRQGRAAADQQELRVIVQQDTTIVIDRLAVFLPVLFLRLFLDR